MMEEIKDIIKSCGLKATPQRICVYQTMRELGHTSADAVIEKVQSKHPTITVATVYNILESFAKAGIIQKLASSDIKMYFDVSTHPHCHLYSTDTHTFTDYNDTELTKLILNYLSDRKIDGFKMQSIDVNIVGTFIDTDNKK